MVLIIEFHPVGVHVDSMEIYADSSLPKPIVTIKSCYCSAGKNFLHACVTQLSQCLENLLFYWKILINKDPVVLCHYQFSGELLQRCLPSHCVFAVQNNIERFPYAKHSILAPFYPWFKCNSCTVEKNANCNHAPKMTLKKIQRLVYLLSQQDDISWYIEMFHEMYNNP